MSSRCSLVIPGDLYQVLMAHLFPGDQDEHGAVIAAGFTQTQERGIRLLARELFLAREGVDYVPGKRGYRMLRAEFVTQRILHCRDQKLVYLAVHNHGGTDQVAFSRDDLASHERGYPALLEISRGIPVGAVVFAQQAAAGEIWLNASHRKTLTETRILSSRLSRLFQSPSFTGYKSEVSFDRQTRLFGDFGQQLLSQTKVGVIGVGGGGSILVELLARLGVGHLVAVDPDRVDITNLPRLVGATRWDARTMLTGSSRQAWMRRLGERIAARKVDIARRVAKTANPRIQFDAVFSDVTEDATARALADCDFLFLAADSFQARLVFNALVHQFLIPGVQIGSKVNADSATGRLTAVFSVSRFVLPSSGCLWCNGLIPAASLQDEAATLSEHRAQRYVEDTAVEAPSVITLNATSASLAANDFLFWITGLVNEDVSLDYLRFRPRRREVWFDRPRHSPDCLECSTHAQSRFARGDDYPLPTKES